MHVFMSKMTCNGCTGFSSPSLFSSLSSWFGFALPVFSFARFILFFMCTPSGKVWI